MLVFFHGCSIIQFGCDCHPHCIKCIATADEYKKFNSCHNRNCKKVDSKGHSLDQLQMMCLRVGRLLLRNILGFRRIRQIHTSFFINLSIIQFGSDCHPHGIEGICTPYYYKKFNHWHNS